MENISNIKVIAQKEFADHLKSPVFLSFTATFTLVILAYSYVLGTEVEYTLNVLGSPDLMRGFEGVAEVVGRFAPVMGIVLGFDAIVREIKSSSMNVLLTHPVFRDNIILGKILGSGLCILLVLFFSVNLATGVMLIISGIPVTMQQIARIEMFIFLTSFYSLIFLAISIMISTIAKKSNNSFLFNLILWLIITILLAKLIFIVSYAFSEDLNTANDQTQIFKNFLPDYHFAVTAIGTKDADTGLTSGIGGIFDTRYTLGAWAWEFWPNLAYLFVLPFILLIGSVLAFLKKDITY
ncbi:ABC transporter permease [Methanosarcina sp. Z-7115]|uniref:ABC transporter permease n=1 Tax=Methanosarcina baikalica TaxID=3073890 RepID=A0ABU2D4L7_9EURY|nr:ABC transporter permease [Methanosarcina sp. Z-7115]MDR7666935.1 ABC transporter permease [Methanosarcina sp. Z-7115]